MRESHHRLGWIALALKSNKTDGDVEENQNRMFYQCVVHSGEPSIASGAFRIYRGYKK